jgi:NADH-quinone oxidoreductase subunit N
MDPTVFSASNFESVRFFWPAILLVLTAVIVILEDLFETRQTSAAPFLTLLGLAAAGWLLLRMPHGMPNGDELFAHTAVADPFSWFFQAFFLVVAAIVVLMSARSREIDEHRGEYFALLLILTLGMMMLASSSDLLMVYLSLEAVSIVSYVLTGWKSHNKKSAEASLKYVLYGAVASGVMLYGLSLLYGMTGSTDFDQVRQALIDRPSQTADLAAILVFTGFAYKIASVPFHMWAPDVYEGAPTPITAFLTVGPKAAGFAALIRFFYGVLAVHGPNGWEAAVAPAWPSLIALISIATMTVGNLSALGQNNVKRLLGYSSIAHAGYLLMGFVVLSTEGLRAVLFYLVVYCAMNLGAFLVTGAVADETGSEDISAFKGLGTRNPWAAISMGIFLFSLVGLPPMAGFTGKLQLFMGVVHRAQDSTGADRSLFWALAIAGVVNSVISLYYYARIAKAMFLESAEGAHARKVSLEPLYLVLMGVLVVPTIWLGIFWQQVLQWADGSIHLFGMG